MANILGQIEELEQNIKKVRDIFPKESWIKKPTNHLICYAFDESFVKKYIC